MRKWQYNVWSLFNQRPCYIICQNGLKGHIYSTKTSKMFFVISRSYVHTLLALLFSDLLINGHKTRGYEKTRHFCWFCRSRMNHGIFDFASPLQIKYYTTYIWTAQFFSHRLYCRLPLLLRALLHSPFWECPYDF